MVLEMTAFRHTWNPSERASDAFVGGQFGSSSGAVQVLEQLLQAPKPYVSTVQSVCGPQTIDGQRSGTMQPTGKATSLAQQFMTPSTSTMSRASSVSLGYSSDCGISHRERLAPVSPTSSSSRNSKISQFDPQLALSNVSSYNSAPQISLLYTPTNTTSSNVDSYIFATDIIGTTAGGDPSGVRADLGWMSDMDCEVDDHLDFNVMD
jgi:hypothetical protein